MDNCPIPQLLYIKSDLPFPEYSLKNEPYDQKTKSFFRSPFPLSSGLPAKIHQKAGFWKYLIWSMQI